MLNLRGRRRPGDPGQTGRSCAPSFSKLHLCGRGEVWVNGQACVLLSQVSSHRRMAHAEDLCDGVLREPHRAGERKRALVQSFYLACGWVCITYAPDVSNGGAPCRPRQ